MDSFSILSAVDQLVVYLRGQIMRGRWTGTMPGADRLAEATGVNRKTAEAALRRLENEGVLTSQGRRKGRSIALPENPAVTPLRVQILLYEEVDGKQFYMVDLRHQLLEMGHIAGFASKTLLELGMDLDRISAFVDRTEADAWVVFSGSREVLEWFAKQPKPAFALAGRRRGIPIASMGPEKTPAMRTAVRRLVALGHRRIVLLSREERRLPSPGFLERSFLAELEALDIPTGSYHLPDWRDDVVDFHRCLDSLFRHTPPTALLFCEMPFYIAAQHHLARKGILAPRHVSLISFDPDPVLAWLQPPASHIRWDPAPIVRRIVQWADNVARGKKDCIQSFSHAEFVEGGTIGPEPVTLG